ncbi:hypothetical protein LOZ04_005908 [Ophidiomyces ophidiicola]|nr:hypothetical protein LOZ34_006184 [Ophidiomyces ophidiicola]KAI2108938.1 hypothetical protein LOZ42_005761 [Ophidiomyces ophidiicola]KAI2114741.1 hypothetical protein LOZ32_004845 [Ophidiomyces ophidiicola]KAI2158758.1 hypothetical protein LOZ25_003312 [Ophidiomyces ophidiicola]KAI2210633.1 hypothetical protein LOZ17_006047 [Ophidiomyces ophidiicola]
MNRFRHKKKPRDDGDSEVHVLPSFSAKSFRRGKKNQIESKSEIDLSTALPSADDFRTSLLMPNLSARFSMLREQDDPTTKIGKANDDSVLFPRRASRLNLFAHNPLTDIAEVSSISPSARPSLSIARTSYTSAEGMHSDEDAFGVLNRRRPVEGNNLFGGRQKVYKIPVKGLSPNDSTRNSVEGEHSRIGGRAIYESDMPFSTFQRTGAEQSRHNDEEEESDLHKEAKKIEEQILARLPGDSGPPSVHVADSQPRSPALSSGSSTPIKPNFTGLERHQTKTRRLYGQGLDLHNQQASALNRIESLRRPQGDASQLVRSLSKSTTNLNEKYQKYSPIHLPSDFILNSPPLSASSVSGNELSRKTSLANSSASIQSCAYVAPLSPPLSENGEISPLAAALQPEDRGKATATGLFNKPCSKYDENQFQQRQVQMYEGRNTPPLQRPSPSPGFPEPEKMGRPRGLSTTSYLSRAESSTSAFSGSGGRSTPSLRKPSPPRAAHGTFLANLGESEPESDVDGMTAKKSVSGPAAAVADNNPAVLASNTEASDSYLYAQSSKLAYSAHTDLKTINENDNSGSTLAPISEKAKDSPTLGPSESGGLSGLIRTHLRHDSDMSSILPPPSPTLPPTYFDNSRVPNPSLNATRASNHSASIHSNPWELDEWSKPSLISDRSNPSPPRPVPPVDQSQQNGFSGMSLRAKQMLDQAAALSGKGHPAESNGRDAMDRISPSAPNASWQEELQKSHRRTGSSETQVEREELAHELAERRRKVQEKLRSIADIEASRSSSPAPGSLRETTPSKPGNAFAMLKTKASRTNIGGVPDMPHARQIKALGMESPSHNASTPNLTASNDYWREEEERMLRDFGKLPRTASAHIGPPRHGPPRPPPALPPSRGSNDENREIFRDGPSHASWRHHPGVRDRSTSDASKRSKSRPRHRDDIDPFGRPMESPQYKPSVEEHKPYRGPPSGSSSSRPSIEHERHSSERSGSAMAGRLRSNSRPIPPNFPENRIPHPVQTNQILGIGSSPRPPPITPYSANATPPLVDTSPASSTLPTPTGFGGSGPSQSMQWHQSLGIHKRFVDKSQISEPKFVSTTSNVPTVGLPPGASLSNGSPTPPVPPMNPRRRRPTATQTILGAFKVSDKGELAPMPPSSKPSDEQSAFSDEDKPLRARQRLRKISSEGGNINAKARQQAILAGSIAMPPTPATPPVPMEGGMF